MSVVRSQVWLIARRSVMRTRSQPGTWIPPLMFPLMLMAVNSNGLRAATHLPGFPTTSFLAFFLPFSFMQGALFASGIAGVDLARDIDTGFLNRLALTPVRGLGAPARPDRRRARPRRAAGVVYLAVGLAAGVHIDAGVGRRVPHPPARPPDRGRLRHARALDRASHRLRRGRAVAVPAALLPALHLEHEPAAQPDRGDWFRDVATINPVSYMIEGLRSLVIEGWNAQALLLGFGFTFALIAVLDAARGTAAER